MVINLRRSRRQRANARGHVWWIGNHRPRRTRINMMRYRVFFNGREVTNRTFYVDSRRGIIRMFLHDSDGRPYFDPATRGVAHVERRGHVRLVRRWGH